MSRANSYSSSVSTLTINAFCSYSTASCDRNSNPKAIHEFAGPKNQTMAQITSFKEILKSIRILERAM